MPARPQALPNYYRDEAGRRLWRTPEQGGLPPSSARIVSPHDLTARYARRGSTRWTGFLAHVTGTCDDGAVNIITEVATVSATAHDTRELAAIHRRLEQRNLLPSRHLVDGGYTSVQLRRGAEHDHQVELIGPVRAASSRTPRTGAVFDRTAFTVDWKKQTVTCPDGKRAARRSTPRTHAPYIVATFTERQCWPCPLKV
jgi:Transposase DDE domain